MEALLKFPDGYSEEIVIHDEGNALWPEWMSEKELNERREAMGGPRFAGIYLGRAVPMEGAMMHPEWIKDKKPKRDSLQTVVQGWDLAWGAKVRGDYTVGVTLGMDREQNAYILDIWRNRGMGNEALMQSWAEEAEKWEPSQIAIENSPGAWGVIQDAQSRYALPFMPRNPQRTQKVERFQFPCARAEAGKLYADKTLPWWPVMETELVEFPTGRHDDMVDALSWAFDLVKGLGTTEVPDAAYAVVGDWDEDAEARRAKFFGNKKRVVFANAKS